MTRKVLTNPHVNLMYLQKSNKLSAVYRETISVNFHLLYLQHLSAFPVQRVQLLSVLHLNKVQISIFQSGFGGTILAGCLKDGPMVSQDLFVVNLL